MWLEDKLWLVACAAGCPPMLSPDSSPLSHPCACACSYGPQWEAHVLSNLPFYLTLLPLFLEASVPRVEVSGRPAMGAALSHNETCFACWHCRPGWCTKCSLCMIAQLPLLLFCPCHRPATALLLPACRCAGSLPPRIW